MSHNATTTATPAEKLWCIHIPGPDDLFAAPDQQTAQKMADLRRQHAEIERLTGQLDREQEARRDAQTRLIDMQELAAKSGLAHRRAVQEAVREALREAQKACENLQPPESCSGVERALWDVATMACAEAILARYNE